MHNKVVSSHRASDAPYADAVVLRFNYRVNLSAGQYDHGVGEVEDARAALALLRSRYPDLAFSLAGFSFGSRIILKLGCETPGVAKLVAVGFPANLSDSQPLGHCPVPKIFIVSRNDQFCAVEAMETYFAALTRTQGTNLDRSGRPLFRGALDQFEDAVYGVTQTTNFRS